MAHHDVMTIYITAFDISPLNYIFIDCRDDAAAASNNFIINDCDVRIERGMRCVVRGPNGAGKSTFLSALSGKLKAAEGKRLEGDGLALVNASDLTHNSSYISYLSYEFLSVYVFYFHHRVYLPKIWLKILIKKQQLLR